MDIEQQLGPEWYKLLGPLFSQPHMVQLGKRLSTVADKLCPPLNQVFQAYEYCAPKRLRVLCLGQDPYPSIHAMGLAYSSLQSSVPKTLRIVFSEMDRTGFGRRTNPDLTDWAAQGVMLLNTILTCELNSTLSHKGWGWEWFVGKTLDRINQLPQPFVIMAWGRHAQDLIKEHIMITPDRLLLQSPHPVAESYSEGRIRFTGCDHFRKANAFLESRGVEGIIWNPTIPRP